MKEGWRAEIAELMLDNRNIEALALVRQAINEGETSARVILAKLGEHAGLCRGEVDRLIEDVEINMDPNDIKTHLELRGAYDIGLGALPYEEKARRRFRHLLRAVELGAGPVWTLAAARIYVTGAIGVEPNEQEAIRWYKHAIDQGSAEAAQELQRYYRHLTKLKKK